MPVGVVRWPRDVTVTEVKRLSATPAELDGSHPPDHAGRGTLATARGGYKLVVRRRPGPL